MKLNFRIMFFINIVFLFNLFSLELSLLTPGTTAPKFYLVRADGGREALRIWCGDTLIKPKINNKPYIVILSFWATYCAPCKMEIPVLHKFYDNYKDRVKIFLINIDKKSGSYVRSFAQTNNYTLPVLLDPANYTAKRYGVKSVPALFVIDKKGVIAYSHSGYDTTFSIYDTLVKIVNNLESHQLSDTNNSNIDSSKVISVVKDSSEEKGVNKKIFTPKEKWHAIARIECGEAPDKIAQELQISKEELRKWYNELKNAAIKIWSSE